MRGDGRELNNFILCMLDLEIIVCHERYCNANQTTIRLLRMQLLSCREASYGFCPYFEMWTYFLENIAIYASAGMIPDTEDQTHFYIARVKPERFLVPVSEMSGYEREHKSYLKVAVWRDPVERLVSAYKYFILERTFNQYMYMCNLYQDCSFERFLSFVEFELGKANPLWQDEHIRRQSDFYTSADVDCIVPLSKLNRF